MFNFTYNFVRFILLAASCVYFTCGFVCFILLAASCVLFYLRLCAFYFTCGFVRFNLRLCAFYFTCGFVRLFHLLLRAFLFYLRLHEFYSACGFVRFILLAASCVYFTCIVVVCLFQWFCCGDITSRLWCDRFCWHCFVTSVGCLVNTRLLACYFLLHSRVYYFLLVWVRC